MSSKLTRWLERSGRNVAATSHQHDPPKFSVWGSSKVSRAISHFDRLNIIMGVVEIVPQIVLGHALM